MTSSNSSEFSFSLDDDTGSSISAVNKTHGLKNLYERINSRKWSCKDCIKNNIIFKR